MSEFRTILKKDMRDVWRTKKFLLYSVIALAMAAFTFIILGLMQLVLKYGKFEHGALRVRAMFELTTGNSATFFMAFLITYFMIAVVIFIRNIVSKEIAENKWTLPLQAGIKPWKLILSKIIVFTSAVLAAAAAAMLLHFVLTLAICKPAAAEIVGQGAEATLQITPLSYGKVIGQLFACYANGLIGILFVTVFVLTMNTITKKSWPAIIVPLAIVMVFGRVCNAIQLGGESKTLSHYLPFLFFNNADGTPVYKGTAVQYIISTLTTALILGVLIFFALRKGKVSGLADKRSEE